MLGKIEGKRRRGWDGWMAPPTQWTWVWVDSGSWWWTGRPGVLRFMGSQRVRYDWATELNWSSAKQQVFLEQDFSEPLACQYSLWIPKRNRVFPNGSPIECSPSGPKDPYFSGYSKGNSTKCYLEMPQYRKGFISLAMDGRRHRCFGKKLPDWSAPL